MTIIGSGFAALSAIKSLRQQSPRCQIRVIAPKAEFTYLPSLIWIPSGLRRTKDIQFSLEHFFRRQRVEFIAAEVTGLSDDGRTIFTNNGVFTNEALIIASGGRFLKKLPGIAHTITPCEGLKAAKEIRQRLLEMSGGRIAIGFASNPDEPSAMRGGPMFEFLFAIDAQLRREGRRDKFQLIFFNPAAKPGQRLGDKAVTGLLSEMKNRNIDTHLGYKLKGFTNHKVVTEGGDIEADLILFMPGMTGNLWFDNSKLPRSSGGLLQGDRYCRVPGFERVYVVGDSGSFPGPDWMPKQAHMADLQARTAVTNLLAKLRGESVQQTFKVELVCIVDGLNSGILVYRDPHRALILPASPLWHWAKRLFEWWYLRDIRY
ncbi:MAG: FAD-dependent oxidoreductase [Gammaproteobacteria bacterium]|nr:FAD-dependent oxidoreductase [Gammaproteobacteria bacterium]